MLGTRQVKSLLLNIWPRLCRLPVHELTSNIYKELNQSDAYCRHMFSICVFVTLVTKSKSERGHQNGMKFYR